MTLKNKLITALVCLCLLLLLAGAGFKKAKPAGSGAGGEAVTLTADDLSGRTLGGVRGRMPANSSKIFFESLLGRKLGNYKDYGSIEEALYALKTGRVKAIWAADATADYLLKTDDTLARIDTSDMASIQNMDEARFEFGMAAADTPEGRELADMMNSALGYLKEGGILDGLIATYIDNADTQEPFTEKDMVINGKAHRAYYYASKPITVGITGAVPPVELIDAAGKPYGFCVALMDEIGQVLQRGIEFEVLDGETAFTDLMSGRVDLIFCYGAGRITTEGAKNWCMTEGYLDMNRYDFLYVR